MASPAIENPPPMTAESKSARKKKAKAEAASNGTSQAPAVPAAPAQDDSSLNGQTDANGTYENVYLKELQKQIRSINKKLSGMQKTDSILAENIGVSLDELVAQRKLNADQKASAEKKPQLQAQLVQLEEQVQTFRKLDAEYQQQVHKQKDDLTAQHQKEMEILREELRQEATTTGAAELRSKLLVFSQFLRAAAAKRNVEEDASTNENMAFEGALLLVYGGDQKAVDAAVNIVEGSEERVPNIEGAPLPIKYSQVKQASIDHAPFQTEEAWVDSVAEANGVEDEDGAASSMPAARSDPTLTNASLTELDRLAQPNGTPVEAVHEHITSQIQGITGDDSGNAAGDRWDVAAGAEKEPAMEESFEIVSRPTDEVATPTGVASAHAQGQKTSWADEPAAEGLGATGNQAGEAWDTKAAGDQTDDNGNAVQPTHTNGTGADGWGDGAADARESATPDSDGFQAVGGRPRGGRGRGRGDGEIRGGRGRGRGGFRGDGEHRGRGRGGFRGDRGERGDYRGRGRGGRGRGEGGSRGDEAQRGS